MSQRADELCLSGNMRTSVRLLLFITACASPGMGSLFTYTYAGLPFNLFAEKSTVVNYIPYGVTDAPLAGFITLYRPLQANQTIEAVAPSGTGPGIQSWGLGPAIPVDFIIQTDQNAKIVSWRLVGLAIGSSQYPESYLNLISTNFYDEQEFRADFYYSNAFRLDPGTWTYPDLSSTPEPSLYVVLGLGLAAVIAAKLKGARAEASGGAERSLLEKNE